MSKKTRAGEQYDSEAEFLAAYRVKDYPRPSLTVDIALFTVASLEQPNFRKLPEQHLQVLLIRRGGHPFRGKWALPGGFVQPTETVEQAARRELEEETAVREAYLEQLYTFSEPGRDPRAWVVSSAHLALARKAALSLKASSDAAEAAWFTVRLTCSEQGVNTLELWRDGEGRSESEGESTSTSTTEGQGSTKSQTLTATLVPFEQNEQAQARTAPKPLACLESDLAFDHASIIAYALERLRNKVEYTTIALELLPELFTLTELQQVHEQILGHELLAPAFRRRIAPAVIATEHSRADAGHRPSRLYRRK